MNSFKALLKREYWESKGSMFYAPASIAAFFAIVMIVGAITGPTVVEHNGHSVNVLEQLPNVVDEFNNIDEENAIKRSKWDYMRHVLCLDS